MFGVNRSPPDWSHTRQTDDKQSESATPSTPISSPPAAAAAAGAGAGADQWKTVSPRKTPSSFTFRASPRRGRGRAPSRGETRSGPDSRTPRAAAAASPSPRHTPTFSPAGFGSPLGASLGAPALSPRIQLGPSPSPKPPHAKRMLDFTQIPIYRSAAESPKLLIPTPLPAATPAAAAATLVRPIPMTLPLKPDLPQKPQTGTPQIGAAHFTPHGAWKKPVPKYTYIVQVPLEYQVDPLKDHVTSKLHQVHDMCSTWRSDRRAVHVIFGVNKKAGTVGLETIQTFVTKMKRPPQTTIVGYEWVAAKGTEENPHPVNYISIRNELFYHSESLKVMQGAVQAVANVPGSYVKVVFLDPDTALASWQLDQAENVWNESQQFHLISTAFHHFDMPPEYALVPFVQGDGHFTLRWEGCFAHLANMHDCRTKQLLAECGPYQFLPVSEHLLEETMADSREMKALVDANVKFLDSLGQQKNTLSKLRYLYRTLQATLNKPPLSKGPQDKEVNRQALTQVYDQLFSAIREQEGICEMALDQTFGKTLLYPSENAMILTLLDQSRGVNFLQAIVARMQKKGIRDLWGNSDSHSGRGEGEKILINVMHMAAHARLNRVSLIDFTALGCIKTLMPPRFFTLDKLSKQRALPPLPQTLDELVSLYKPGVGFGNKFLTDLVKVTSHKPESSLQFAFMTHRLSFLEKQTIKDPLITKAVDAYFKWQIPALQEQVRDVLIRNLYDSLIREIFLSSFQFKNPADVTFYANLEKQFSLEDKKRYQVLRAITGALFFALRAPQIPIDLGREVLGFYGFGY